MKAQRLLAVTVVVASLSSCGSFNHYQLTDEAYRDLVIAQMRSQHKTVETVAVTAKPETPHLKVCPPYQQPALPKVPEVPWQELSKTAPSDWRALDAIQQNHISELRIYIQDVLSILREANEKYVKECEKYRASL